MRLLQLWLCVFDAHERVTAHLMAALGEDGLLDGALEAVVGGQVENEEAAPVVDVAAAHQQIVDVRRGLHMRCFSVRYQGSAQAGTISRRPLEEHAHMLLKKVSGMRLRCCGSPDMR